MLNKKKEIARLQALNEVNTNIIGHLKLEKKLLEDISNDKEAKIIEMEDQLDKLMNIIKGKDEEIVKFKERITKLKEAKKTKNNTNKWLNGYYGEKYGDEN